MRWLLILPIVLLLVITFSLSRSRAQTYAPVPTRVVLVVLDTLRADRIEATRDGMPLMPHLKAMAGASHYYTRAVSQSSWTRPAMASIFTSLYLDTHRVRYLPDEGAPEGPETGTLSDRFRTMAGFLRDAGFRTAAVQANPIMTVEAGFAQGFEQYTAIPEATADQVTDLALEAFGRMAGPSFLYVHYMDPHNPYEPPEPYRAAATQPGTTPQDHQSLAAFNPYFFDQLEHAFGNPTRRFPPLSTAGRETARALYDGEVRFLDQQVGRLLEVIRRQPATMVVVVADHGEELWDHGAMGHGGTMYDEQVVVPLIVQVPGGAPKRIDSSVETLDILPTIAAALRLAPDPAWQGMELQDRAGRGLPVFSHTRAISPRLNLNTEMVELGGHKLIVKHPQGRRELYDLTTDPREQRDLSGQYPRLEQALLDLLERHRAENLEHLRRLDAARRAHLSDDTVKRLRALGYLQ